jgi:bacillithiol biosynthesis cysteine-adding enzyme BshC
MESNCIRYTEIPGTSRLFADYVYHFDRVASFYRHAPGLDRSFSAAAAELHYPDDRRAALADVLEAQNGPSPHLERFRRGAVAVITGQQVGLFSGPAYSIYKALTAANVARRLTAQGLDAVPIFWLATEDHDFPEVNHHWSPGVEGAPLKLAVESPSPSDTPVGGIVPPRYPLDQLRTALGDAPFAGDVAAMVAAAYQPGRSLGDAFRALIRQLLSEFDLLCFDPLHPGVRDVAAPFLAQAVEAAPQLQAKLLARNAELTGAGYHAQVHVEPSTSLFFLLEEGRRKALRRQNGDYTAKDLRLSTAELAQRATHLSPNALLRPVLQDYLFPTVAYVGGPAELAYFAQSHVLYEHLLGRMPVMLPRNSFTIMDTRSAKLMDRFQLQLTDVTVHETTLRERIAAKLIPPAVPARLAEAQRQAGQMLDSLRADLLGFDPSLAKAVDRSERRIRHQFAKLEAKAAREALRRDQRAQADASHLIHHLYPHEHLQERFYSILHLLAQHGPSLIPHLAQHACLDCVDHHVLVL